jgi:uncharacterized protein YjiS (DUF1127 family)
MLERNNSVPLSSFVQAERLARVERGSIIKACVRGTMRRFAEWLRVLGVFSIRLARDLTAKRVLRSAIRELQQLDDRMLADIGISRGEIESAVRNGLPTRVIHTGASHHARRDTSSADLALFRNTPYRQGTTLLLLRQSDSTKPQWEFPRLCRGGSKSLTYPAVDTAAPSTKLRMVSRVIDGHERLSHTK